MVAIRDLSSKLNLSLSMVFGSIACVFIFVAGFVNAAIILLGYYSDLKIGTGGALGPLMLVIAPVCFHLSWEINRILTAISSIFCLFSAIFWMYVIWIMLIWI